MRLCWRNLLDDDAVVRVLAFLVENPDVKHENIVMLRNEEERI